jgi:hypothetical protein
VTDAFRFVSEHTVQNFLLKDNIFIFKDSTVKQSYKYNHSSPNVYMG